MQTYKNLNGDSGVREFDVGDDFICVRFRHDARGYVYNAQKPGAGHVERMKGLALAGRGLGTYISRYIQKNYSHREL